MDRYIRQMNLPEIGVEGQKYLQNASIVMVGAGGLGAAALPYLAAAGVGNITIIDHDTVALHNLHRQTIFRTDQVGKNKAECAADYLRALNPDINVFSSPTKLTPKASLPDLFRQSMDYPHKAGDDAKRLILDGSDNFETKSFLNNLSITYRIPIITASVEGFSAQFSLFEGWREDQACYRCLFPEFPLDARNCNEAGILGTTAGLAGVFQAHMALCTLLGLENIKSGIFYSLDFKTMRTTSNVISKNLSCAYCAQPSDKNQNKTSKETFMIEILSLEKVLAMGALVIDVRQPEELVSDPLTHPQIAHKSLHIPLGDLPHRLSEIPRDRTLALICAGNIRSVKGANFLAAQGFDNVCVLDKFSL